MIQSKWMKYGFELKNKILKNDKYLYFTLFKYLEYGINALVFFALAKMVDPKEYGSASFYFITITYSSFAILGINQVLVKRYALEETELNRLSLVSFNIVFNFFIAICVFVFLKVFLGGDIAIYVAGIASLKILQESTININRVYQNLKSINITYLSFSFILGLGFIMLVIDINSFFRIWMYSLVISNIVGWISIFGIQKIKISIQSLMKYTRANYKVLSVDGFKLATIGMISPLFFTLDRLMLIEFTDLDSYYIGNMQLAENIAALISFGFSSLMFIVTPKVIDKLNRGVITTQEFYTKLYKLLSVLIICLLPISALIILIVPYFFDTYNDLAYPMFFFMLNRLLILGLFIPNMICITFSKEFTYIKNTLIGLITLVIGYIVSVLTFDSYTLFYLFPLIVVSVVILLHILFYREKLMNLKANNVRA